jgi:hypothetical protein
MFYSVKFLIYAGVVEKLGFEDVGSQQAYDQ